MREAGFGDVGGPLYGDWFDGLSLYVSEHFCKRSVNAGKRSGLFFSRLWGLRTPPTVDKSKILWHRSQKCVPAHVHGRPGIVQTLFKRVQTCSDVFICNYVSTVEIDFPR